MCREQIEGETPKANRYGNFKNIHISVSFE
jgi:hypothetical protein